MLDVLKPRRMGRSGYHPTGTYISVDFVYKPESLVNELRGGSYGDVAQWEQTATYYNYASKFACEEVGGVLVYGTPAGIDKLKCSIELLLQYGFWDDVSTQTKVVVAQAFADVAGCGECPGSTIWVSPEYGVIENCDTIYHEYLHNVGWTGEPIEHQWVYQQAGKVASYLAQFA